jgi:hypothetical protein
MTNDGLIVRVAARAEGPGNLEHKLPNAILLGRTEE